MTDTFVFSIAFVLSRNDNHILWNKRCYLPLIISFHLPLIISVTVPGGLETRYSCCEGVTGSPGCQVAKVRVI